ncbi:MAG: M4 family metallopeptidase [Chlamydiia bacterium]|nr:M4 family metallopeptidase [Chlamydiia bacterium]
MNRITNDQAPIVSTYEPKTSCCCQILPPHVQVKIQEIYEREGEASNAARAERNLNRHHRIRQQRAVLCSKKKVKAKAERGHLIKIYDAGNHKNLPGALVEDPTASNDDDVKRAYEWNRVVGHFYKEQFERGSINNEGMPFVSTVNYGKNYANAFWYKGRMIYGDGDGRWFDSFTRDLDVAAHEMTHGVTEYDIQLEYQGPSGALNESLSDVFGSIIKQQHNNETVEGADWLIGKNLIIGDEYALRSLKSPGTAYDHPVLGRDPQPSHMTGYDPTTEDNGGVHINSGIPNHAAYLAAENLYRVDEDKFQHSWNSIGPIWYAARENLNNRATFADFAQATLKAAAKAFPDNADNVQGAVSEAWQSVGVLNEDTLPNKRKWCCFK